MSYGIQFGRASIRVAALRLRSGQAGPKVRPDDPLLDWFSGVFFLQCCEPVDIINVGSATVRICGGGADLEPNRDCPNLMSAASGAGLFVGGGKGLEGLAGRAPTQKPTVIGGSGIDSLTIFSRDQRSAEPGILPPRNSQAEGPFPETTLRHRVDLLWLEGSVCRPWRDADRCRCVVGRAGRGCPPVVLSFPIPGSFTQTGQTVRVSRRTRRCSTAGARDSRVKPHRPAAVPSAGGPSPVELERRPAGRSGVGGRLHNPTADRRHPVTTRRLIPDPPGRPCARERTRSGANTPLPTAGGCCGIPAAAAGP